MLTFSIGLTASLFINLWTVGLVDEVPDPANLTLLWQEPKFPPYPHSCGILVVSLVNDRSLYLKSERRGDLDHPEELLEKMRQVFGERTENRVYRVGVDPTSDIPEEERIEKTVFIKASPSVSYGEVAYLIALLKETGANPIGLVAVDQSSIPTKP